jgi:hypothetical protein
MYRERLEGLSLSNNDILDEMHIGSSLSCCYSWFEMLGVSRWTPLFVTRRHPQVFAFVG